jgi:hypothetical protein
MTLHSSALEAAMGAGPGHHSYLDVPMELDYFPLCVVWVERSSPQEAWSGV